MGDLFPLENQPKEVIHGTLLAPVGTYWKVTVLYAKASKCCGVYRPRMGCVLNSLKKLVSDQTTKWDFSFVFTSKIIIFWQKGTGVHSSSLALHTVLLTVQTGMHWNMPHLQKDAVEFQKLYLHSLPITCAFIFFFAPVSRWKVIPPPLFPRTGSNPRRW